MKPPIGEAINVSAVAKWLTAGTIALWASVPGTMQVLLILMAIDYMTGLIRAYIAKEMSSSAGLRGLFKKTLILVVLLVAHVIERSFNLDVGVVKVAAVAYSINEAISIIENCAKSGVPIPAQIVTALMLAQKFKITPATPEQLAALEKPKPDAGGHN